jgi:hypothetical protein
MPKPRPPYLHRETNRHGRVCWYFRRDKGPRIRISAAFGTPEFNREYAAALAGEPLPSPPAERNATGRPSKVYFIRCGARVKIGVTNNVRARLASLQTGNPERMRLLKSIDGDTMVEREMHKRFGDLRDQGEWFHLRGALAEFLQQPSIDKPRFRL